MPKRRNYTPGIKKLHKYNPQLTPNVPGKTNPEDLQSSFLDHIQQHNDFFSEGPKAHSMEIASEDPQKFLKLRDLMSIKKVKGVAL